MQTLCLTFRYCVAFTILTKSGFNDAPPTRDPSISLQAAKSRQFPAVTEPPYKMRRLLATSAEILIHKLEDYYTFSITSNTFSICKCKKSI